VRGDRHILGDDRELTIWSARHAHGRRGGHPGANPADFPSTRRRGGFGHKRGFFDSGTPLAALLPGAACFAGGTSGALPNGRPNAESSPRGPGALTVPVPSGWQPTKPRATPVTAMTAGRPRRIVHWDWKGIIV
jgi:hypothetical protein